MWPRSFRGGLLSIDEDINAEQLGKFSSAEDGQKLKYMQKS